MWYACDSCQTLPEWEKYHGLNGQELHLGVISTKQFFGGDVEEEESIEGESDADVVDNCYVQVSMMSPAHIMDQHQSSSSHSARTVITAAVCWKWKSNVKPEKLWHLL